MRSSEGRKDVVDAFLVEDIEHVHLNADRYPETGEVCARGEVPDGPRRDAVRVEVTARMDSDVREREGVVGVVHDRLIRARDEPGVISSARGDPETGLAESVVQTTLDLKILIVVDQNMSVIEGSLGILPRRVLVPDERIQEARTLLEKAGIGAELVKPKRANK